MKKILVFASFLFLTICCNPSCCPTVVAEGVGLAAAVLYLLGLAGPTPQ